MLISRRSCWAAGPSATASTSRGGHRGDRQFGYNALVLVGLCLMVSFLRERPINRRMALCSPESALCTVCLAGMAAGHRLLSVADYASATYRRYVECRDGLTRLGPHLRPAAEELPRAGAALPTEPRAAALITERALHRPVSRTDRRARRRAGRADRAGKTGRTAPGGPGPWHQGELAAEAAGLQPAM
ncbi:DUF6545 domain-containing protein [Streptomyces sp. NPDC001851]|uniref:DUF6545 domain-containing protein n=1 Tax=Streptomyces sp. NPDC001851 TaxID=3154529 RepID=UPI0033307C6F